MALDTHSKFYYGHEVTSSNLNINLDDTGVEVTAELRVGFYSLTEFIDAVEAALNEVGDQIYTVSVDRDTRLVTISSTINFELLFSTGIQSGTSARTLLGAGSIDYTGSNTYTFPSPCGSEYLTQFWIQDYVAPGDSEGLVEAAVNVSANGQVEVIKYGSQSFLEMNLKWITDNNVGRTASLRTIQNQVENTREFLRYLITKGKFEFMPDEDDTSTYYTCILEKTPESSMGVAYKLKEQVTKNIPNIYETGLLTLRIVED